MIFVFVKSVLPRQIAGLVNEEKSASEIIKKMFDEAEILLKKAADAAEALHLTSGDLFEYDVIEKIIDETDRTQDEICSDLKACICAEISEKETLFHETLLAQRYEKFRKIGA